MPVRFSRHFIIIIIIVVVVVVVVIIIIIIIVFKTLVGNLKERDHSEDPEDDTEMDLREVRREDVDWTHLAQDRDQ
jgi:flagellar basal body-associated protein FliL